MAPYTPSPSLGREKQEEQTFKVIGHPLLHFEASLGLTCLRLSLTKNKNTKKEEKEQKEKVGHAGSHLEP